MDAAAHYAAGELALRQAKTVKDKDDCANLARVAQTHFTAALVATLQDISARLPAQPGLPPPPFGTAP